MVLTVHHLSVSQSERITWLLEELHLPYELKLYTRRADNNLAPDSLKNLPGNYTQSAPVFHDSDGDITLAESGAIMDYILARYGSSSNSKVKLVPDVKTDPKAYARYADWMHRANGSALPSLSGTGIMEGKKESEMTPRQKFTLMRWQGQLRYAEECLGRGKWFAGEEFTAADVMCHFVFSGMRFFAPYSLKGYPNILRWTADCMKRPAFMAAFEKGDKDILQYMPLGEDPPTNQQKPWKL